MSKRGCTRYAVGGWVSDTIVCQMGWRCGLVARGSCRPSRRLAASSRLATIEDARDLFELLDHPGVRDWIYSLPRPLTLEGVRAYIETCVSRRERGEVLLSLNFDEEGRVSGFSEVHIWPEWAAGEVAGAMRPDLQNKGQGGSGMAAMFTWMFDAFSKNLSPIVCAAAGDDL